MQLMFKLTWSEGSCLDIFSQSELAQEVHPGPRGHESGSYLTHWLADWLTEKQDLM